MSFGYDMGGPAGLRTGERDAEEVLGFYGILTEKDWLSRLESTYLTADQKQKVREMAYVTLVSLADFYVRWRYNEPKSTERSLDLLQRAEAFHQPTRAFYFVRATCRHAQGDAAAAAEDDKQFKAATARTAWDYFLPGHTAGWRGDLDEAMRSYQAALHLQPDHFNSLFFLALRLDTDKINRRPEAIAYFTGCIALRPDYSLAYRHRGNCYLNLGQIDNAVVDLRQALRLHPDWTTNHVDLGHALYHNARPDEALAVTREAIRLAPRLCPCPQQPRVVSGQQPRPQVSGPGPRGRSGPEGDRAGTKGRRLLEYARCGLLPSRGLEGLRCGPGKVDGARQRRRGLRLVLPGNGPLAAWPQRRGPRLVRQGDGLGREEPAPARE